MKNQNDLGLARSVAQARDVINNLPAVEVNENVVQFFYDSIHVTLKDGRTVVFNHTWALTLDENGKPIDEPIWR